MSLLEQVNNPKDIKKLNNKELQLLSNEVRETIIDAVNLNGGHLASNLGLVETTISLLRHFDFTKDKIIFDVGHQCYTYKLLTDRKDKFFKIRSEGGISGFPDPNESPFDSFISGHAGTSISVGLGMCRARDLLNEDYYVVVVVGDGAFVNGINLEALTLSNTKPKKFIIILNDNGMSISKNTNGLYHFIAKRRIAKSYIDSKKFFKKVLGNSFVAKIFSKTKRGLKRVFKQSSLFDSFGFKTISGMDGNDIKLMDDLVENIKRVSNDKAVLLHINTTKGKGYLPSENEANKYHGVGKNMDLSQGSFSLALGNELCSLMSKDDKIVAFTAGMRLGTGLDVVANNFPKRFFDVGIAEDCAVATAGGMAKCGLKPIVAIYSTFLQRAYDQIVHDICIQNLPVVFCLDRAGVVGADGVTHQGIFDLSYLSHIPNLKIFAPSSPNEFKSMLGFAFSLSTPVAIRYPSGKWEEKDFNKMEDLSWQEVRSGSDLTLVAVGPRMNKLAMEVCKNTDKNVGIINARVVKPVDKVMLDKISNKPIIVMEENSRIGGLASLIENYFMDKKITTRVISCGIDDKFVPYSSIDIQLKNNGLSVENICSIIDSL